jgi:hypothetical protein
MSPQLNATANPLFGIIAIYTIAKSVIRSFMHLPARNINIAC